MFELMNFPIADVLDSVRKMPLSGWFTLSGVWIFKGTLYGGFSKLGEYLVDCYCINHGMEKRYDICEKDFDYTNKFLSPIDWMELKSPYFESPISICLRRSNATNQDLMDHLVEQKFLKKLDVSKCSQITWEGVQAFCKARPDCKVTHTTRKFWSYTIGVLIGVGTLVRLIMEFLPFFD